MGGRLVGTIKRNRGIRQGCKVSPLLFVLLLNKVVDRLNDVWRDERWNILMYADDALILGRSEREIEEKVNVYRSECREMGLEVNVDKSEIMVVGKSPRKEIAGLRVVEEMKYLGVWFDRKGGMRRTAKEKVESCKRLKNYVGYLVCGRQRKLELGRLIWKGGVVPVVIYGLVAMGGKKGMMDQLELLQRKFGRMLLEVPGNTPWEFVERECRFSGQRDRVEKARIKLLKRILDRESKGKLSVVESWNSGARWIVEVKENLRKNNISVEELEDMSNKELEKKIKDRKRKDWWKGIEEKRSLKWYGRIERLGKAGKEWESDVEDRRMKRYWCGAMEHIMKEGVWRCMCVLKFTRIMIGE
mgnify:CR=1 FL=1